MNLNQLKKALAKEAQEAGICAEWYNHILSAPNKERLLVLFYSGLDFVIGNDFPSKELRAEFRDIRKHFDIYDEGDVYSRLNPRRLLAYEGTEGRVLLDGYAVCQLWARQGAGVEIHATANSYATIDVAPGARVTITAADHARVSVFQHGGSIQQHATGEATIKIINY